MNKKNLMIFAAFAYFLTAHAEVSPDVAKPEDAASFADCQTSSVPTQAGCQTCPTQTQAADCAVCPMPEKIKRKADKPQQLQINPQKFPRYLESLKKFASLVKNCAHNINELRKTEEFAKIKADLREIVQIVKVMAPQIAAAKAQLLKASSTVDSNLQEITELRKVNIEVEPLINLVKAFNAFANQTVETLDQFAQEVHNNKQLQELLA